MNNPLGANYKTALTGIGTALFSVLTLLAALPYQLGDLATVIPPEWKSKVVVVGLIATTILRTLNAVYQKDKNVTGGTVVQDTSGNVDQVATAKKEIMENHLKEP